MATRNDPYIYIRLQQNMTYPENTTHTPNKGTRNILVAQDSKKHTATHFKKKGERKKKESKRKSGGAKHDTTQFKTHKRHHDHQQNTHKRNTLGVSYPRMEIMSVRNS